MSKRNRKQRQQQTKGNKTMTVATTYKVPAPCHAGDYPIFSEDGITVFAGGYIRKATVHGMDVIIDLANNIKQSEWELPEGWDAINHVNRRKYSQIVLNMPIDDYGIPEVKFDFWMALWGDLVNYRLERGLDKMKVLVFCTGGHGRTGTVVTALALTVGAIDEETDPIEWLRGRYCEDAVETTEQINYLEKEFDFKSTALASGGLYEWENGSYWNYGTATGGAENNPTQNYTKYTVIKQASTVGAIDTFGSDSRGIDTEAPPVDYRSWSVEDEEEDDRFPSGKEKDDDRDWVSPGLPADKPLTEKEVKDREWIDAYLKERGL